MCTCYFDDLFLLHNSTLSCACRSQAKAAVAYNYKKRGGAEDSDDSDTEFSTYHGEEGEDKTFSSESEYGEALDCRAGLFFEVSRQSLFQTLQFFYITVDCEIFAVKIFRR